MATPFDYLVRQACRKLEEDIFLTLVQKIEIFEEIQRDCLYASRKIDDFFEWKSQIISFKEDFPSFNKNEVSLSYLEEVFNSLDFSKINKIKNLKFNQRLQNPFYKLYFRNTTPVNDFEKIIKYMILNDISTAYVSSLSEKCSLENNFEYPSFFKFYSLEIKCSKFFEDIQISLNKDFIKEPFLFF